MDLPIRVDWFALSSGGTVSSAAAPVRMTGTIARIDASQSSALVSQHFRLRGGFWAFEPAVPTCSTLEGVPLGDANHDCSVNTADLLNVIHSWGRCAQPCSCIADLDSNGAVDMDDLLLVITNWSQPH
jgi:hypothetical protein